MCRACHRKGKLLFSHERIEGSCVDLVARTIEGVEMDTNTETSTEMAPETQPKAKRPAVVTVAAVLLIVLSLFVAGLGIANQFGLGGRGFGTRNFTPGQFRGGNFTPPSGFLGNGTGGNDFQGNGSGSNGIQGNGTGSNGFFNGGTGNGTTRNFVPNRTRLAGIAGILRILRPVMLALDIIILVLAVIAAIGLFNTKRWAAILAIVVSGLVILLTLPGMLRIFFSINLVENVLRILLAIAVIVLVMLPSARRSYATSRASNEPEEVERVVR
jgi:hypothetical protein